MRTDSTGMARHKRGSGRDRNLPTCGDSRVRAETLNGGVVVMWERGNKEASVIVYDPFGRSERSAKH